MSIVSNNTSDGAVLQIKIHKTIFKDNHATDGGGALYATGTHQSIIMINCQLLVSGAPLFPLKPLFILSSSRISVQNCTFIVPHVTHTTSLNEMQVLSSSQSIYDLFLEVRCPSWHWLQANYDFGTSSLTGKTTLQRFTMRCASCPLSFYFQSDGKFSLLYKFSQDFVQILNVHSNSKELVCLECPYGANCPGNQLNAKPNFWGLETAHKVIFVQCPSGYCCANEKDKPCVGYTMCDGHREGALCGACEKDYSLSLLSHKCIPLSECHDTWVWPVAMLGIVFYMLWYTFKDDILSLSEYISVKLKWTAAEKDINVDHGYFGIMIYFVQATAIMKMQMERETSWHTIKIFQHATTYINLFLTVELKYFSFDLCPDTNMNTTLKTRLNFLFYCGIFASWFVVFIIMFQITKCFCKNTDLYKAKMISGLVEIIKYTYGGFTDIVFYSLAYTSISGEKVWFYDGTVKYFSVWQCEMIAFAVFYIIPFPFVLYIGLNLLRQEQLSCSVFLCGLFLPLPALLCWIILLCKHKNKVEEIQTQGMNEDNIEMFCRFQGGYKNTGLAPFWECVMILRRLLLSSTAMIPNSVVQLTVCLLLCGLFLIHHILIQPFHHSESNRAEGLSLFLLCAVALVNTFRAVFFYLGVSLYSLDNFMDILSLLEAMFVPALFFVIILMEAQFKLRKVQPGQRHSKNT